MLGFLGIKFKKAVRPSVLVVDDEPNFVQTVQDRLEMNDYTVHTAYDGIDALAKAVRFKPDIVLLDIIMPEMDGLEMLEALRANPNCEDISVIMLTARSHTDDMERAHACGIEDYIVKPFELRSLLEKIEIIIQNKKARVV